MIPLAIRYDPEVHYPFHGQQGAGQHIVDAFGKPSNGQRSIYRLVESCLYDACTQLGHPRARGPLSEWIQPGDRVFALVNLVMHQRTGESPEEFVSKCTHGSVLRPVLDCASLACGDPSLVSFGNAPLQSCDYAKVAAESGCAQVGQFYRQNGYEVGPYDLRALVSRWTRYGTLVERKVTDADVGVRIDLGPQSLLAELFRGGTSPRFAVGDYPLTATMSYHSRDRHIYVLNRRVLESNVIISVPKLKTHQKVGITCALKGTVGAIARKECLAHHRVGSPSDGGDEYPRASNLRLLASWLERKGAEGGAGFRSNTLRFAGKVLRRSLQLGSDGIMGGAWDGNDTAWRMALDIARVLRYARPDGTLSPTPVRRHLAVVDGIIGGQAEGPLRPQPRHIGVVLFSPDVCVADAGCAMVMGFDISKVPLVNNSFRRMPLPLTEAEIDDIRLMLNGSEITPSDLRTQFAPPFVPPKGWRRVTETAQDRKSPSQRCTIAPGK